MDVCHKQRLMVAMALLQVASVSATEIHGDTTGKSPVSLETLYVEGKAFAVPGTTALDAPAIQNRLGNNLADVFRVTPEVTVGGGRKNAQRIYLNGIEGSNLNIRVDGAPSGKNLHQHRGGFTGFDPDLLKQIDIQGTSGVSAGPGALGGSIQMTTVDAQDLLDRYNPHADAGVRLKAGSSSVDSGKHGDFSAYGLLTDKLGILAHVSASNRGDYETGGSRTVTGSGGQDRDYLVKLSLLEFRDQDLKLGVSRSHNAGLYARGSSGSDAGYLPENPTGPSTRVRQETEEDRATLEHRWNPASQWLDLRSNIYHTKNILRYPGSAIEDTYTRRNGAGVRNDSAFELAGLPFTFTVGADWLSETAYTHALNMDDPANWPDLTGQRVSFDNDNLGVSIESTTALGDLTTTLGVRFDQFESDYGSIQLDGDEVSPAVHLDYALNDAWSVFAGYSEAVRASGIVPVGFLGRLNQKSRPRGGSLGPEKSRQTEVGFQYSSYQWPLSLELNAFETRIDDAIQTVGRGFRPLDDGDIYNSEQLEVHGWRAVANWRLETFTSRFAFSANDVEYGNEAPGAVRRLTAPTGDTFTWENQWHVSPELSLGYTMVVVADLTDVPDNQPNREGYHTHGVRASWEPAGGVELGFAVENLFDREYADHTSLYSSRTGIVEEPGRDVRLNLALTF
ncbi:MAG: TonB-dependent receptor [Alteromonadaceae bacterium]|nr:TonB-dependent receptor [Alteromonadaceae bacterium]